MSECRKSRRQTANYFVYIHEFTRCSSRLACRAVQNGCGLDLGAEGRGFNVALNYLLLGIHAGSHRRAHVTN